MARALTDGASFASVARDLGLTRQAIHRRYRDLAPPAGRSPSLLPTPEARLALRYAGEEAAALGAAQPRGEHVLLGLLRAGPRSPLEAAGVTYAKARAQIDALSPRPTLFRPGAREPDLRTLLAGPACEAIAHGSRAIGFEHVLLSVLRDPTSGAARTLHALGVDPGALCAQAEAYAEPWLV